MNQVEKSQVKSIMLRYFNEIFTRAKYNMDFRSNFKLLKLRRENARTQNIYYFILPNCQMNIPTFMQTLVSEYRTIFFEIIVPFQNKRNI